MNYFADGARSSSQSRLADYLGHQAHLLICGAIVGVIAIGVYPLEGPFAVTVPFALLLTVVGSWLLMRQHDRRLCEQCAASLPLNPSEQAAHYQRRFWLSHAAAEPRFVLPYFAVLIGSNFAGGEAGRIAWAIIQASMIYLIVSHATHRRLQPWCQWCQGGDGRDDRDEVAPPPPPVDRRLPV